MQDNFLIKVCGMRDATNIERIANLDINWMGFIFYEKSKRYVGEDLEEAIVHSIPDTIKKVGVFVNAQVPIVFDKLGRYQLDFVQLHGDESPEYCQDLRSLWPTIKIIKAFSVDDDFDFAKIAAYEAYCDYFLFDTKGKDYGGNGIQFDWDILEKYNGMRPFLISGGIGLADAEALKKLHLLVLAGVDINSKFEISPALKEVEKVARFVEEIRKAKK